MQKEVLVFFMKSFEVGSSEFFFFVNDVDYRNLDAFVKWI